MTLMPVRPVFGTAADESSAALGKRIYRQGILPSGQPLRARVQRDVEVEGAQLVCENCHGRSGLGQGEGTIFMPPITGASLYEPREIRNKDFHVSRTVRPAYTDETLARAIRSGVDATGRELNEMMPRYALDDDELRALGAYLKSLSSRDSPGVSETHIHFATVISEDVKAEERNAVLDVLEKFFARKNAGTRLETRRAVNAPGYKQWHYEAYRKWVLHVWELRGPQDSWLSQLEALYDRQPVFAVVSGIATGSWQPVHAFCEQGEIPCLFPNTNLPVISGDDYYSVYFSKGMTLEAEALAKHLQAATPPATIVQVYRDDTPGADAAAALRRALEGHGITRIRDRRIGGGEAAPAGPWQELLRDDASAWLVLWLSDDDLPNLDALTGQAGDSGRIYVSSSLLGNLPSSVPDDLRGKVYAIHPFDLPEAAARRSRPVKMWLRSNGIEAGEAPLQMNALFTATVVAQALKHIGSNFYRDYFLERVEHILDSMVTPSAYPKLTLAPHQRFASNGCYIVHLSPGENGGTSPASEWIVP
jgi:ABC-type branched-subunit amino acid transport system substrate-binding protein/mono/diheme cytochrome c family protein